MKLGERKGGREEGRKEGRKEGREGGREGGRKEGKNDFVAKLEIEYMSTALSLFPPPCDPPLSPAKFHP